MDPTYSINPDQFNPNSDDIRSAMNFINTVALPARVINGGIGVLAEFACQSHPTAEKVCEKVGDVFQGVGQVVDRIIPDEVKQLPKKAAFNLAENYGIPIKETEYALESGMIVGGAFVFGGAVKTAKIIKLKKGTQAPVTLDIEMPVLEGSNGLITGTSPDAFLKYYFIKKNKTMNVHVNWLGSEECAGGNSVGTVGKALTAIKEFSRKQGVKELYIQWNSANQRLLDCAKRTKHFTYLGEYPHFSPSNLKHLENIPLARVPHGIDVFPTFKVNSYKLLGVALPILGLSGNKGFANQNAPDLLTKKFIKEFLTEKQPFSQKPGLKAHFDGVVGPTESEKMVEHFETLREILQQKEFFQAQRNQQEQGMMWEKTFSYLQEAAHTLGSRELAKAATLGKTGYDIYQAETAIQALGAGASIGAIAPHAAVIAFAAVSLVGLFQEEDEDESINAFNQLLLEQLQSISRQIEESRKEMRQCFDLLDQKIKDMYDHIREAFHGLSSQMVKMHGSIHYNLNTLQHDLSILWSELNYAHDQQFLSPLHQTLDRIEHFKDRNGISSNIPSKEFKKLCISLEQYILNPSNAEGFNGALYLQNKTPRKINQTLLNPNIGSLLGYFVGYAQSNLMVVFPEDVHAASLPNIQLWQIATKAYIQLRLTQAEEPYDTEGHRIQAIIDRGNQAISAMKTLANNQRLYNQLVDNYEKEISALKACEECFLEHKREEALRLASIQREKDFDALNKNLPHPESDMHPCYTPIYNEYKATYLERLQDAKEYLKTFDASLLKYEKSLLPYQKEHLGIPVAMPYSVEQQNYNFLSMPLLMSQGGIVEKIPAFYRLAEHFSLGRLQFRYKIANHDYTMMNGTADLPTREIYPRRGTSFIPNMSYQAYGSFKMTLELSVDVVFTLENGSSSPVMTISCKGSPSLKYAQCPTTALFAGMPVSALIIDSLWKDPSAEFSIQLKNDQAFENSVKRAINHHLEMIKKELSKELAITPAYLEQVEKVESSLNLLKSYSKLAAFPKEVLDKIESIQKKPEILDFQIDERLAFSSYQNWPKSEDFSNLKTLIGDQVTTHPGRSNSFIESTHYFVSRLHACILQLDESNVFCELSQIPIKEVRFKSKKLRQEVNLSPSESSFQSKQEKKDIKRLEKLVITQSEMINEQKKEIQHLSQKMEMILQLLLQQQNK